MLEPQDVVLMRFPADCEVGVVGTVCRVTWERAREVIGWKDLPGDIENPVFGNPWNVERALVDLGFVPVPRTVGDILDGKSTPGRTILLVHLGPEDRSFWSEVKNTLLAHWVVWDGIDEFGRHRVFFGKRQTPHLVDRAKLAGLLTRGGTNYAVEAGPADVPLPWWATVPLAFAGFIAWLASLFW
jgi:hypothetical protein